MIPLLTGGQVQGVGNILISSNVRNEDEENAVYLLGGVRMI